MSIIVFNGARTLLTSELSGTRLLAVKIGKEKEVLEHLEEYNKRKGPWGLEELAKLFIGTSKEKIQQLAREIIKEHLNPEAKKVVEELKKEHEVYFISSDILEIAKAIDKELGLNGVLGTELAYNGVCKGMARKIDRYDRARFVEALGENVFVIGSSITAIPAKQFGTLIALNPGEELKKEADKVITNINEIKEVIKCLNQ